ncbi:MAG: L-aspartate oxidase [Cyanobacteria bacterium P01_C01_bin.89]
MLNAPPNGLNTPENSASTLSNAVGAGGLGEAFDVIVVGAGAAGLYSALCLPSHYRVAVLSKEKISRSASKWAQGGLAAVVTPDDSTSLHVDDTLRAGAELCDRDAVEFLVTEAAAAVSSLVDLGVAFDRDQGNLAVTLEAAHSRRRVVHAADITGRAIVTVLLERVLERSNILVFDQALALDVILDKEGHCSGVVCCRENTVSRLEASAVILGTGGGGQVFAKTTNPALSTGDGVAIAHRSGATLRDLEFIQFHPTALMHPGAPHFLISEAVRGEGAHLVDHNGCRFAFDYHPKGELAPRDVVSRAVFNHLRNFAQAGTPQDCVWLDLRPIPQERLHYRFPNILDFCQKHGLDPENSPIPVAPAAHYWMGGIASDRHNQTSIPGLYAVGETASTGVHGANRLASNSLLECIVFGAQFQRLTLSPRSAPEAITPPQTPHIPQEQWTGDKNILEAIAQKLPQQVWEGAGISRNAQALDQTLAQVKTWQKTFDELHLTQYISQLQRQGGAIAAASSLVRRWSDTRNLLAIARLILTSAQNRTESRGGHYREDYPESDHQWQTHTWIQGDHWWTAPTSAFSTIPTCSNNRF